jgi:hypothetical protein
MWVITGADVMIPSVTGADGRHGTGDLDHDTMDHSSQRGGGGDLRYAVVSVESPAEGGKKLLVVASDLVESLAATLGCALTVVGEMTGAQLEVRGGVLR